MPSGGCFGETDPSARMIAESSRRRANLVSSECLPTQTRIVSSLVTDIGQTLCIDKEAGSWYKIVAGGAL